MITQNPPSQHPGKPPKTKAVMSDRRYDIDWLRSLAFILLIFYHIAQFYVFDWNWHIKSAYQSEFLQNIMLLVNQWRMPLIFLISGTALALVEARTTTRALLKTRFVRIFMPLVIGMYLIVPPQLYFELIQKEGFSGDYFRFFRFYIDADTTMYPDHQHGPLGLLTWNHLWYLAYLWHYTLIYLVLKPLLTRINFTRINKVSPPALVLIPVSLFIFYGLVIEPLYPSTNALVDDWYNHALYFTVFLLGYMLAKSPAIWQSIIHYRKTWLILAIFNYLLVIIRYNRALGFDIDYLNGSLLTQVAIQFIWCANKVFWLLAIIGFAGAYLNKKHPLLAYMNQAVLPWYILHQTLIIIFAACLAKFALGPVLEPLLLILMTFAGCFIGYEVIKRFTLTRFIFGLKVNNQVHGSALSSPVTAAEKNALN
ncbi:acyltransferase family protein [Thalassomonas actiniarum]|uniref:Acyltransferase family protein n=1 Tax=Thalassomonas actiniarum TaxID=485447 RepID=A0AAE9YKU5_9GAMM|nr:acyltransferase family protein [Thalassomonas actiniarum]WDD97355.1 acyltransferase family protein [Thalassomonas actiniarum]